MTGKQIVSVNFFECKLKNSHVLQDKNKKGFSFQHPRTVSHN